MNGVDWQEIEKVLATVMDLPPGERPARIAQLCADRPEIRTEVESLLAAHEKAASFLEGSTQIGFDPAWNFSFEGKHLGPYRLLATIGAGGMGTVYRAERTDGRFQKQVAIKVVPAALHSPELLRRFSSEQHILAALEHPNIARLLDAGVSTEGVPYLVMEYVEGMAVSEYCRANSLSTRKRLQLFRTICSAVHYAHQHLVVHRDLKPGNILVSPEGTPKLLDFGIAKIVDPWRDSGAGGTPSILNPMTPDYASPEQARGGTITTATDIYSLGVVLFELLTEEKPYKASGKPQDEAIRTICETEPEKIAAVLRHRNKKKDGISQNSRPFLDSSSDLDAIVGKAMRKDPQQRYPSAQELFADVSRHLAGLPISAHRGSLRYVAGKFVARHRVAVMAVFVASLLAIGAVTAIVWQARIAQRERARAQGRFNQVRSLAKSLIFEIHDSIKDLPGATPARQLLVSRASEYLNGLSQEAGDDPGLQRELAAAYERLGDVQGNPELSNLGDPAGALASYRRAVAIRESLLRADPANSTRKLELSWNYFKIGICMDASGDFPGALNNLQKAQSLAEQSGDDRGDPSTADALSAAYWAVARVTREKGDLDGALQGYRKAVALRESARVTDPAQKADFRTHLAGGYREIAEVLRQQGHPDAAVGAAQKALTILQASAREDPTNATLRQWVGAGYDQLGSCLEEAGLLGEALENFRKGHEIFRAAMAADPSDTTSSRVTGFMDLEVGRTLVKKGDARGGLRAFEEALDTFQELAKRAPNSNYLADSFGNAYSGLGMAYAALGDDRQLPVTSRREHWRQARSWYEKSLAIWLDLKRQGKLANDEVAEPDTLHKKIGKCDEALAHL